MISIEEQRRWYAGHLSGVGFALGAETAEMTLPDRARIDTNLFRLKQAVGRAKGGPAVRRAESPVVDPSALADLPSDVADFVVVNHLLETAPNPLKLLCDLKRVIREGGVLLLTFPIADFNPDSQRPITPLARLVERFEADSEGPADEHLLAFTHAWRPEAFSAPQEVRELLETLWAESRVDLTEADYRSVSRETTKEIRDLVTGWDGPVRHHVFSLPSVVEAVDWVNEDGDKLILVDASWSKGLLSECVLVFRVLSAEAAATPAGRLMQSAAAATVTRIMRTEVWIGDLVEAHKTEWTEQHMEIGRLKRVIGD